MSIGIAAVILVFCLSGGITNYVNDSLADSMNALQIQVKSASSFWDETIEEIRDLEGVNYVSEGSASKMNSTYDFNGDTGTIMMLNSSYENMEKTFLAGGLAQNGEIIISQSFAKNIYNNTYKDAEALIGQSVKIILSGKWAEYSIQSAAFFILVS